MNTAKRAFAAIALTGAALSLSVTAHAEPASTTANAVAAARGDGGLPGGVVEAVVGALHPYEEDAVEALLASLIGHDYEE